MPTAIAIRKIEGKPGQVYYPLDRVALPTPAPEDDQVVIRLHAAALNHRDLFLRQHLYPGIAFGVPLLADGSGVVVATGSNPKAKAWLGKRVVLNPGTGWESHPDGPEDPAGYAILGGTRFNPVGTLAEVATVHYSQVEETPSHLTDAEAAALPLAGLTAWRAVMTKSGNAQEGRNILVTGIGGGVAIMALLFAVASGCRVYVTSGSEEKIENAKRLGAVGGVNYKEPGWEKKLQAMLPKERKTLDAIIDGAGSDIVEKGTRLLKAGGIISIYGMTVSPKMPFIMPAVLKNVEVRGSTMGSRKEFAEMMKFVKDHKLTPVVSRVTTGGLDDLEGINGLFEDMKKGSQFGKLVVQIAKDGQVSKL